MQHMHIDRPAIGGSEERARIGSLSFFPMLICLFIMFPMGRERDENQEAARIVLDDIILSLSLSSPEKGGRNIKYDIKNQEELWRSV